jgi:hypothetical protein
MTAPFTPATTLIGDNNDLAALARRVERLTPSHCDPEAFHIEKSEIAHSLRRMARATHNQRLDRDRVEKPRTTGQGLREKCQ